VSRAPSAVPDRFSPLGWYPERPRLHPLRIVTAWIISAVALQIDGPILPVLRQAIRDGTRWSWLAGWPKAATGVLEWETDLSSQTGATQAGILLGDNDDIPAFLWVH
jgi:hypothetical protein